MPKRSITRPEKEAKYSTVEDHLRVEVDPEIRATLEELRELTVGEARAVTLYLYLSSGDDRDDELTLRG